MRRSAHGRLPRRESRELGRAGGGACRVARLRRLALHRRPGVPERRRDVRPPAPRRHPRPRRGAPAVPHRHRHRLAGAARRQHDGARLLGARDRAGPQARARRPASRSTSSSPTSTARPRRSAASASTSSSPASARSAGCPTCGAGPRSSPACCGRAAGSSSARDTRCCGRSQIRCRTGCWRSSYPYFEQSEPLVWEEGGTYVETDQEFTQNVTHEWNHGIGEIITAVLDAGLELTAFEEHDSVPWDALPGWMTDIGRGEFRLTDRPERLRRTATRCRRAASADARSSDRRWE